MTTGGHACKRACMHLIRLLFISYILPLNDHRWAGMHARMYAWPPVVTNKTDNNIHTPNPQTCRPVWLWRASEDLHCCMSMNRLPCEVSLVFLEHLFDMMPSKLLANLSALKLLARRFAWSTKNVLAQKTFVCWGAYTNSLPLWADVVYKRGSRRTFLC